MCVCLCVYLLSIGLSRPSPVLPTCTYYTTRVCVPTPFCPPVPVPPLTLIKSHIFTHTYTTPHPTIYTHAHHRMIGNILKKPDEAKFRRINLANAAFTKRVGAVPGGITFLKAVGYVKDDGENALVLGADCDLEIVRQGDAELGGYIAKMAGVP